MKFQIHWTLLGVFLSVFRCTADTHDTREIKVSITGSFVTVKCPQESNDPSVKVIKTTLVKDKKKIDIEDGGVSLPKDQNGEYECNVTYNNNELWTRRLYLRAKVCDTCVDMGFWTVAGIVIADLLVTVGVVILVYYWSKHRKGSPAAGAGGAASRRPRGDYKTERPPPVPNPDYEPIRKGQRDVYDGLRPPY